MTHSIAFLSRCAKGDPERQPDSVTPSIQFYFYDSCRLHPDLIDKYAEFDAGIRPLAPKRPDPPKVARISYGSRPRRSAWCDPDTLSTLYSQALVDCLNELAETLADGRTVIWSALHQTLEKVVEERTKPWNVVQEIEDTGKGSGATIVHRRPAIELIDEPGASREVVFQISPPMPVVIRHRTPDGRILLVAEVTHGAVAHLRPGKYEVVLPFPWGGEYVEPVAVPAGEETLVVEIGEDQWISRVGTAKLIDRRLAPAGPVPRRAAAREPVFMRFLRWAFDDTTRSYGFDPIVEDAPPTRLGTHDESTDVMIIDATPRSVLALQLRTPSGQSIVTVLPAVPLGGQCALYIRAGKHGLKTLVRFGSPRTDSMAGYLTAGRPDRALALTAGSTLDPLLWSDEPDAAIMMALAGYALLKVENGTKNLYWAETSRTSANGCPTAR
jgi:hypothetical protein